MTPVQSAICTITQVPMSDTLRWLIGTTKWNGSSLQASHDMYFSILLMEMCWSLLHEHLDFSFVIQGKNGFLQ